MSSLETVLELFWETYCKGYSRNADTNLATITALPVQIVTPHTVLTENSKRRFQSSVQFAEYVEVHMRLHKALRSHFYFQESYASAVEDWKADTQGNATGQGLTKQKCVASLSEIAKLWAPSESPSDQAAFLQQLFHRVARRKPDTAAVTYEWRDLHSVEPLTAESHRKPPKVTDLPSYNWKQIQKYHGLSEECIRKAEAPPKVTHGGRAAKRKPKKRKMRSFASHTQSRQHAQRDKLAENQPTRDGDGANSPKQPGGAEDNNTTPADEPHKMASSALAPQTCVSTPEHKSTGHHKMLPLSRSQHKRVRELHVRSSQNLSRHIQLPARSLSRPSSAGSRPRSPTHRTRVNWDTMSSGPRGPKRPPSRDPGLPGDKRPHSVPFSSKHSHTGQSTSTSKRELGRKYLRERALKLKQNLAHAPTNTVPRAPERTEHRPVGDLHELAKELEGLLACAPSQPQTPTIAQPEEISSATPEPEITDLDNTGDVVSEILAQWGVVPESPSPRLTLPSSAVPQVIIKKQKTLETSTPLEPPAPGNSKAGAPNETDQSAQPSNANISQKPQVTCELDQLKTEGCWPPSHVLLARVWDEFMVQHKSHCQFGFMPSRSMPRTAENARTGSKDGNRSSALLARIEQLERSATDEELRSVLTMLRQMGLSSPAFMASCPSLPLADSHSQEPKTPLKTLKTRRPRANTAAGTRVKRDKKAVSNPRAKHLDIVSEAQEHQDWRVRAAARVSYAVSGFSSRVQALSRQLARGPRHRKDVIIPTAAQLQVRTPEPLPETHSLHKDGARPRSYFCGDKGGPQDQKSFPTGLREITPRDVRGKARRALYGAAASAKRRGFQARLRLVGDL